MKRLLVAALLCILMSVPETLFAQTGLSLSLRLVDASNEEPVPFATVSLTVKGGKTPSGYALTDQEGKAKISKLKAGDYVLKAELMGYKAVEQAVTLSKSSIDLGDVKMDSDVQQLEAAKVTAAGNPIIVKKDTIEYNASSFRTTENDMLENLLKKLPGVEVGSDGSVTVNGETITKITIDGKTFFLDDPQLATKNIPAKIVEKVKVVEKKSDQAKFTGIDDGEEETVIDLSLRPGMMKGWFGNVSAGGGHDLQQGWDGDWRGQGAAMIGRFTDKSQISIILNGNNTNNRGFNDMAGSMMRSMRGGGGGMGGARGGWGQDNGITTSWMGGANGAWTLLDGNMDLAGNYLYNGSATELLEKSDKITYLDGGDQLIYNNGGDRAYGSGDGYGFSNTLTQGHRLGVRLEHKFTENTSIIFEPQVNFGYGNYIEDSKFSTGRLMSGTKDTLKVNDGFNFNAGSNSNWTTSGRFLLRQKLGKPGRTLSLNVRYEFSGNKLLDALNQSLTTTYDKNGAKSGENTVNQKINRTSDSQNVRTRLSYTEPLGNDFYLEATYGYNWSRSYSNKLAKDSGPLSGDFVGGYGSYNPVGESDNYTYSSTITNIAQNHNAGVNLQYQKGKLRVQVGASLQPTVTHNVTDNALQKVDTTYTTWRWAPQAMFSYEFNDNSELRFFYRGRSSQPSTSQLLPVPDNSNPLNVSFGNPYLQPYFSHNLRGFFGYTNKQTFFSIRGRFSAGLVQNPIVSAIWYGTDGAQYNMPLNGPLNGNAGIDFFINSPIAKSNFSVINFFRANYSQSSSYIGTGALDTSKYYDEAKADFNYDKFNADFFENNSPNASFREAFSTNVIDNVNFTERLSFKYSNDFVELNLGGRTTYNRSWYTLKKNQDARWNNQVSFSMNWTIPYDFAFSSELNYNWYNGYTTPQEDEFVLSAEFSKSFLKKQLTLSIKGYDLLNQSKNLSITDASNYHQEVRNNTLGRYVILSLTWRFGNFGKAGQQMRGGPGGRGPMGPPPGH
ncbi:MAG: outer membrane beta-barrel protein [Rikenellaceae bacterium]|nr:outer membrane beta-barrel protein [Rikenellaceae bacterium]